MASRMTTGWRRQRARLVVAVLGLVVGVPLALTLLFRFVPPPVTPLMVIRAIQGHGLAKDWRPLAEISPYLRRSVIAAEDAKFCTHHGFDVDAIANAIDNYGDGDKVLGASTISMQTAKNVFLWPGRTFLRKGAEAYLTVFLEALWPKRRILEVYLNIVEFGPGVYGAEAASRQFFGKPSAALSAREAALLTAVLPAPLRRSVTKPSAYVSQRVRLIRARADQVRLGAEGACR